LRWLVAAALLVLVYAATGDLICEPSEVGNSKDCAMVRRNYVCDSFPNDLPQYDPDCNTTVGQSCYDSLFTYSNGRGSSCYPGNCTEGTGCTTSCTSGDQCASGFCIGNQCEEVCDGCNSSSTNYEVYPFSTTIYLGEPTFVSFRVNRLAGSTTISLSTQGPCTLEHDSTLDLSGGYGVAVVRIDDCNFTGLGSVKLTVNGEAYGVVHFLSHPALKYHQGEMPRGTVGYSAMPGNLGGVPLEVKTWVG